MTSDTLDGRARWLAFAVLCLGDLMIVLDSTIVNVALPSIRASLGFSGSTLVWVVNAYLLTFGGFLLLGGRLADLYGRKRLFIGGIILFTAASLACGLAPSQGALIASRAIQGIGGAVVSAVALSLIMTLFPEGPGRIRAMGYFGFVMAGGGSVGVLLGGLITHLLDWRWVFLVNIPIGAVVIALCLRLLPESRSEHRDGPLDVWGAITVTSALILAVYGVVGAEQAGWTSVQTLGLLAAGAVLFLLFVAIEAKARAPLAPLGLFRRRNVWTANVVAVLWAAGMFAWFFLSALYMQLVLGYDPMRVGLGFLPANLIMAAFSFSLSAKAVNRFGVRIPMVGGLVLAALGLLLFAFAPADGSFWLNVLPAMSLLGVGAGLAFNPLLLAAMNDLDAADSGLASGLVNTSFMMGGSLGLAVLASLASARTHALAASGVEPRLALTGGYHAAFLAGAAFAALAAVTGAVLIRVRAPAGSAAAHAAVH
jgi:EmrB/QacA subfamily drug resistance transporter